MPLSTWDERIAVLPALYRMEELSQALDWAEVVVLMKVASVFGDVWRLLQERNLLQHTSLVEWVGWEKQAVHPTLERLEGYLPHYFSIAIVRSQPIHFGRPK
jgi:precorrin-2/cobalt-factor-2 C20-methyltransferase